MHKAEWHFTSTADRSLSNPKDKPTSIL
jgi:hypothetical protein